MTKIKIQIKGTDDEQASEGYGRKIEAGRKITGRGRSLSAEIARKDRGGTQNLALSDNIT